MSTFSRRKFLGTAAGAAGSAAVMSALGRPAFAQTRRIRHFWWGNPDRDRRTFEAIEIFNAKHPGIEVVGETLSGSDYFTRLTTQIAGGNMADVIHQGPSTLPEYVERGALLPLDPYIGNTLDISLVDQSAVQAGTVDGQFFGLTVGANATMAVYNKRLYEAAGIIVGENFDPFGWTYDDVKRIGVAIREATGIPGTDDNTASSQNFRDFIGQKGSAMFSEDGEYIVTQEIVEEYWEIWRDIREAGATPPGPESASLASVADLSQQGVVTGRSATSYLWSNQLVGTQALIEDPLGAAMYPNTPAMIPGSVARPSQVMCLSRDTVDPEAATTYMSAIVNDFDMTAVLGLERGIPEQSAVREMLLPTLSPAEAESVAFFEGIQGKTAPMPPPPPAGFNEIEQTFERIAVGVLVGQDSIPDAAASFLREAQAIRQRS